ncbi:MAG: hypothetical protein DLM58_01945 [Pseudonocardiales bacterium]|nr:MAG: hypothetical protein DLM58_01945 [Pseudonocardiales bacterium]
MAGCESLPAPVQERLAPTGTPIGVGLLGALLILVGWLLYWSSRRRRARRAATASPPSPEDGPKPTGSATDALP